ncbi:MAG: hypothetical protein HYR84_07565 [Planctomycetes bacterium]|nr:hypothetical protein [Planctomycetota bacterium]
MGRTLETLKLADNRKALAPMSAPADAAPVQECVVDWEIGAEVPFVEVGAPGKKMELSPGLMQHAPQAAPQPPHRVVDATPIARAPIARLTPTEPMTAVFEPWPANASATFAFSPDIVAYHQPDHPVSKEYANLLTTLLDSIKVDGARVLLLVGSKPHVGASTVLLNLAVCGARNQRTRTIAVESKNGDLVNTASPGFAAVIDGSLALEQAIVKTGLPSLDLLPAGTAAKLIPSDAMKWLTAWLRGRYELILIDAATKDDFALAGAAAQADGVYLVLPQGEPASLHRDFVRTLASMGGRLRGLIHTRIEV